MSFAGTQSAYSGAEPGIPESGVKEAAAGGDYFQVTRGNVPAGSIPIFDDHSHAVIGYRTPYIGGVARLYDLDGRQVGMDELGLESTWFDPIDLMQLCNGIGGNNCYRNGGRP